MLCYFARMHILWCARLAYYVGLHPISPKVRKFEDSRVRRFFSPKVRKLEEKKVLESERKGSVVRRSRIPKS